MIELATVFFIAAASVALSVGISYVAIRLFLTALDGGLHGLSFRS